MSGDYRDFGVPLKPEKFPVLSAALSMAKSASCPVKDSFLRASLGGTAGLTACVAVHMHQIAFSNAETCRFIASAGTGTCRSIFLRNADTLNGCVMHLTPISNEKSLLDAILKLNSPAATLEMYIMGGESRCDYTSNESFKKHKKDFGDTAEELEVTLSTAVEHAKAHGIKILPKVINLYDAKLTQNAVLDLLTGDFFYVSDDVIMPHIIHAPDDTYDTWAELSPELERVFG
jgi:hypothetical protein